MNFLTSDPLLSKLQNSDILKDLDRKLSHLDLVKRNDLKQLFHEYEHLFPDIPTKTDKIFHDVDIDGSKPVKQHPYRMNPVKQQYLREKNQYLLDNDFNEPNQSDWSSSCILVPKPHGTFHMCTDFLSVAWPTGVQLLVFFCSSVPVVLFDTPGISRCRSQHISVESSSLLHHSIYL